MKNLRIIFIIIIIALSINTEPVYSSKISPVKKFYSELSKKLKRNKDDYPDLNDNEFANFREINMTGISKGKLYRSSSPVNDWGNRNLITDRLSEKAGIKTFINLVDSNEKVRNYKGFYDTYYSKQNYIALNINLKFHTKDFQNKLVKVIKFIANNEAPFLIHCNLGKDRTGFVCAIIECLMGATSEEIISDYMISFYNYFGIKPYTKDYNFVVDNELRPILSSILGVKSIENVNLSSSAEKYLLKIGVTQNEIENIREKLR